MPGPVRTAVAVSDLNVDTANVSEFFLTGAKVTSVAHGYFFYPILYPLVVSFLEVHETVIIELVVVF